MFYSDNYNKTDIIESYLLYIKVIKSLPRSIRGQLIQYSIFQRIVIMASWVPVVRWCFAYVCAESTSDFSIYFISIAFPLESKYFYCMVFIYSLVCIVDCQFPVLFNSSKLRNYSFHSYKIQRHYWMMKINYCAGYKTHNDVRFYT